MELRDIEIFLTLAEELHFGRTAARLHVTPARVSQSIKQQERRIGAALFERTSRSVRLTPMGEQLRNDLRPVYIGLRDSLERARMSARGITAVLRVGMMPFNTHDLYRYWKTFRGRHPQWKLQIRAAPYVDTFAGLRTGDMDVLVAWLPVEEPDLTVGPVLFTDRRILAVSIDNELAGRSSVSMEVLPDFPQATAPRMLDYWEDAYLPFHTPNGYTIDRSRVVTNSVELITLVSNDEIIHPFPAHVTMYWSMPHVRWLPIPDMPPLPFVLVWRTDAENERIRALAQVVRDLGPLNRT
jgi:DNA-binding transcriptional LysR family regulator